MDIQLDILSVFETFAILTPDMDGYPVFGHHQITGHHRIYGRAFESGIKLAGLSGPTLVLMKF